VLWHGGHGRDLRGGQPPRQRDPHSRQVPTTCNTFVGRLFVLFRFLTFLRESVTRSIWCLVDWIMILTDDMNDYDGYYLEGF
jgi:hypothetical protein